jgi:hypothetical protein
LNRLHRLFEETGALLLHNKRASAPSRQAHI